MNRPFAITLRLCALALFAGALCACSSNAINTDAKNSFLTADDLITMTDNMASSIASSSQIAQLSAGKPMVIVMKGVDNRTAEIIPSPGKDIFVARVRGLLTAKPELRQRFAFVLNKQTFETLKSQEGYTDSQLGPDADRLVPEYALKATFYTLTNVDEKKRSDYYLCTYQLTSIGTGETIWQGQYETKKAIAKGFLD